MIVLSIPGHLTTLNEHINANNRNRYIAAKIKKEETETVMYEVMNQMRRGGFKIEKYPITIHFKWFRMNKKSDPDNISFAKKYILDGMQKAGLIENDGWKQIRGFSDSFHIDTEKPRTEIYIMW